MPTAPFFIEYQVRLLSIAEHMLDVSLTLHTPDPAGQTLTLPAWIPGSYMIRDFARNIVQIHAVDENQIPLELTKLDKQSWQLPSTDKAVTITYQIYANDFSVRSAFINDQYAFFNGTSVFLCPVGLEQLPSEVIIEHPTLPGTADWQLATTLPLSAQTEINAFGHYQADNYLQLIDHPILMGELDRHPFQAEQVEFELVLVGGHQADIARIVGDLQRICSHHLTFFTDQAPIQRYVFLTLLAKDGFGGLEHSDSTALMYPRQDLPSLSDKGQITDGYRTFLSLCSHELFHTWHVKRIKPAVLHNPDLSQETYTEQLWIYEGFTSYYDDLSLLRSGVIDIQSYLELLGQQLTRLHKNVGRFKQSITESSFYAWNKFYKQDASAINNITSYYNKGAVLALCLDLHLRQNSQQQANLDKLMHLLWQQFGQKNVGTDNNSIQQLIQQHWQLDMDDVLHSWLYSTEELPYQQLLENSGVKVHFRASKTAYDKGGKVEKQVAINAFGAKYSAVQTGVKITQVSEQSPACQAGLMTGDQLLAIDGWQVNSSNLQAVLDNCQAADVSLQLLRDGRWLSLQMPVMAAPEDCIYLSIKDEKTAYAWLNDQ